MGKTTLLEKLAEPGRKYVTLDNPLVRDIAVHDPALFIQRYSPPVIIDCVARTSQMVNYADMAKDVGISPPTAKQWLSILV